jgi:hypothetical protein
MLILLNHGINSLPVSSYGKSCSSVSLICAFKFSHNTVCRILIPLPSVQCYYCMGHSKYFNSPSRVIEDNNAVLIAIVLGCSKGNYLRSNFQLNFLLDVHDGRFGVFVQCLSSAQVVMSAFKHFHRRHDACFNKICLL